MHQKAPQLVKTSSKQSNHKSNMHSIPQYINANASFQRRVLLNQMNNAVRKITSPIETSVISVTKGSIFGNPSRTAVTNRIKKNKGRS